VSRQSDHPRVALPPPLLFVGSFTIGLLVQWLHPISLLRFPLALCLGIALFTAGAWLGIWGERTMKKAGTNVNPLRPATALVTSGPFRFSRNPLYLAMVLLYLGLALAVNSLWPLVLLIPLLVVLHYGVILREERYLESKFGDAYRDYRAAVRRWL